MQIQYGSVQVHLKNNLSYPWIISEKGCVRGYAYAEEELLEGDSFLNYLLMSSTQEELRQKIFSLNGLYSFILQMPFGVVACVDQVRSMPLFYRENELFDALDEDTLPGLEIDPKALAVYKNCVFTPNKRTLFKGIFQIETGHYLLFDSTNVCQYAHFRIQYAEHQITDMDEAIRVLDDSFTQTVQRTIMVLKGRTAVIPLSGGHDSRLLAFYLKRLGYKNIIAYSYGLPGNKEAVYSERAAKILGIPWYFVESDPKGMQELYQRAFRKFALFAGNGTSVPHLQEWYAVAQLQRRNVLPEDCVLIPGYAGDFTAGAYIWRDAIQKERITVEELIQFILKYEFSPDYLLGREMICSEEDKEIIRSTLQEEFPVLLDKNGVLTAKEANQLIEDAISTGWNSKFIANAVRVFDFLGYQWLMPFFERSQFETWSRIDNSLRCFRTAYFEQARRAYMDELNAVDFAVGESINWDMALQNPPNFVHFMFGYFHLDKDYYQQIQDGAVKGPNIYIQDDYIKILQDICGDVH